MQAVGWLLLQQAVFDLLQRTTARVCSAAGSISAGAHQGPLVIPKSWRGGARRGDTCTSDVAIIARRVAGHCRRSPASALSYKHLQDGRVWLSRLIELLHAFRPVLLVHTRVDRCCSLPLAPNWTMLQTTLAGLLHQRRPRRRLHLQLARFALCTARIAQQ